MSHTLPPWWRLLVVVFVCVTPFACSESSSDFLSRHWSAIHSREADALQEDIFSSTPDPVLSRRLQGGGGGGGGGRTKPPPGSKPPPSGDDGDEDGTDGPPDEGDGAAGDGDICAAAAELTTDGIRPACRIGGLQAQYWYLDENDTAADVDAHASWDSFIAIANSRAANYTEISLDMTCSPMEELLDVPVLVKYFGYVKLHTSTWLNLTARSADGAHIRWGLQPRRASGRIATMYRDSATGSPHWLEVYFLKVHSGTLCSATLSTESLVASHIPAHMLRPFPFVEFFKVGRGQCEQIGRRAGRRMTEAAEQNGVRHMCVSETRCLQECSENEDCGAVATVWDSTSDEAPRECAEAGLPTCFLMTFNVSRRLLSNEYGWRDFSGPPYRATGQGEDARCIVVHRQLFPSMAVVDGGANQLLHGLSFQANSNIVCKEGSEELEFIGGPVHLLYYNLKNLSYGPDDNGPQQAILCSPCTAGRYSGSGTKSCSACAHGMFSGVQASACCPSPVVLPDMEANCTANGTFDVARFLASYANESCTPVGAFEVCGVCSAGGCSTCQAGTLKDASFTEEENVTEYESEGYQCAACPRGSYKSEFNEEDTHCEACAEGTFAPLTGSSVCSRCSVGGKLWHASTGCCPSRNSEGWKLQDEIYAAPGKSQVQLYRLRSCSDPISSGVPFGNTLTWLAPSQTSTRNLTTMIQEALLNSIEDFGLTGNGGGGGGGGGNPGDGGDSPDDEPDVAPGPTPSPSPSPGSSTALPGTTSQKPPPTGGPDRRLMSGRRSRRLTGCDGDPSTPCDEADDEPPPDGADDDGPDDDGPNDDGDGDAEDVDTGVYADQVNVLQVVFNDLYEPDNDGEERVQFAIATDAAGADSCIEVSCESNCHVFIDALDGLVRAGEKVLYTSYVEVSDGSAHLNQPNSVFLDDPTMFLHCGEYHHLTIQPGTCRPGMLYMLFVAIASVVVITCLLGLALEAYMRTRQNTFVVCRLDIELPPAVLNQKSIPTKQDLWQNVLDGLKAQPSDIPIEHFTARKYQSNEDLAVLHIEFAVQAAKGKHNELRQRLVKIGWGPAPSNLDWKPARVEMQVPGILKEKGRSPGMDLVEFVDAACRKARGLMHSERSPQQLQQARKDHMEVADKLLEQLMKRRWMCILGAQYIVTQVMFAALPIYGYLVMTSCIDGYPTYVHLLWLTYALMTCTSSLLVVAVAGGPKAGRFMRRSLRSLLLRLLVMLFLVTDTYQDVTFTVLAKKCNFDLWRVSFWLLCLGVFGMQVCFQLIVVVKYFYKKHTATTPEEKERYLVQGLFLALRGSDNLILVFSTRPAVEKRLGGIESWAMKMQESRVPFLRFVFEDVEQGALQYIFLAFFESSGLDQVFVVGSIITSSLSMLILIQLIPEVRDWLWYRFLTASWLPVKLPVPQSWKKPKAWRVLRLAVVMMLYRLVAAFPWIQACSPEGDVCTGTDTGVFSYIWGCKDQQRFFFGFRARLTFLETTAWVSVIAAAGFSLSGVMAFIVHQMRLRAQRRQGIASMRREEYQVDGRLKPASVDQVLRPKDAADDDCWLPIARSAYKTLKGQEEDADIAPADGLSKVVEQLDKALFNCSRHAEFGFLTWRSPFTAVKMTLEAMNQHPAYHFLSEGTRNKVIALEKQAYRTLKLAQVQVNVSQLLDDRSFVRASLKQKAERIKAATQGTARLRLLHWSVIERLGYLPKMSMGEGGTQSSTVHLSEGAAPAVADGAEEVPVLLERIAQSLGVTASKAQNHLVPVFLSHRWLRSSGPQDSHHPDSVNHVKAQTLVAFAKWYMDRAAKTGLKVEVVFWIDWCCCEQGLEDLKEVGIAALPLYIASCSKILAWRTPNFECRCWTMVERLLAYSFCLGGAMPYSIGEDFRFPVLTSALSGCSSSTAASSQVPSWQVHRDGEWEYYDASTQARLHSAQQHGENCITIKLEGEEFQLDTKKMVQRSARTGEERPVRPVRTSPPAKDEGLAPRVMGKEASEPELLRPIMETTRNEGSTQADLRVRRLVDPLDFDSCKVTRLGDRRAIAHLVDIALRVPALEYFEDRAPVEWGLTEVMEQMLSVAVPLEENCNDINKMVSPVSWLKPTPLTRSDWQLIVRHADSSERGQTVEEIDALVYVDHGIQPADPRPELPEIELAFQEVDLAWSDASQEQPKMLSEAIGRLIPMLKADLLSAAQCDDVSVMEETLMHAREVVMPEKMWLQERVCELRLQAAMDTIHERVMRQALRIAERYGCSHLPDFAKLQQRQRELYGEQLEARLRQILNGALQTRDIRELASVHEVATRRNLTELRNEAWRYAEGLVEAAKDNRDFASLLLIRNRAEECAWGEIEELARTTAEAALKEVMADASGSGEGGLEAMRTVEQQARQLGNADLADHAAKQVQSTATQVSDKMGLPRGWDVVAQLAGKNEKLLKKSEESESLKVRIQQLVDHTFRGWGPLGRLTRTRDRAEDRMAKRLLVQSVIYVQNAESYINYQARRTGILGELSSDLDCDWSVKTAAVSLKGAGRHEDEPVDAGVNEYYLWHGTTPQASKFITDSEFDISRAGSSYGSLFGPGVYFAESCLKADEYAKPDERGWRPLILCRVMCGNVQYCDAVDPVPLRGTLESLCRPGGGKHAVLGDREKVKGTFREFVVFDTHQVYPEYIVWYSREY